MPLQIFLFYNASARRDHGAFTGGCHAVAGCEGVNS